MSKYHAIVEMIGGYIDPPYEYSADSASELYSVLRENWEVSDSALQLAIETGDVCLYYKNSNVYTSLKHSLWQLTVWFGYENIDDRRNMTIQESKPKQLKKSYDRRVYMSVARYVYKIAYAQYRKYGMATPYLHPYTNNARRSYEENFKCQTK